MKDETMKAPIRKCFVAPSQCDYARMSYGKKNKIVIKLMDGSLTEAQHKRGEGEIAKCFILWKKNGIQMRVHDLNGHILEHCPELSTLLSGGYSYEEEYVSTKRAIKRAKKASIDLVCEQLENLGYTNLALKGGELAEMIKEYGWERTDQLQYSFHVNDSSYYMAEVRRYADYLGVVSSMVSVSAYDKQTIENVLFESMDEFEKSVAGCTLRERNQIIAKCLFQHCTELRPAKEDLFDKEEDAKYYLDKFAISRKGLLHQFTSLKKEGELL